MRTNLPLLLLNTGAVVSGLAIGTLAVHRAGKPVWKFLLPILLVAIPGVPPI